MDYTAPVHLPDGAVIDRIGVNTCMHPHPDPWTTGALFSLRILDIESGQDPEFGQLDLQRLPGEITRTGWEDCNEPTIMTLDTPHVVDNWRYVYVFMVELYGGECGESVFASDPVCDGVDSRKTLLRWAFVDYSIPKIRKYQLNRFGQ